jgi:hypothetical protein
MVLSDWLDSCLEELLLIPELDQPSTVHQYLQKEQQIQLLHLVSHFKNTDHHLIQILSFEGVIISRPNSAAPPFRDRDRDGQQTPLLRVVDPTTARDSRASPVPRIPTNPPSTRMRKRSMSVQDSPEGVVVLLLPLPTTICWLDPEAVFLHMAIRRRRQVMVEVAGEVE